MTDKYKYPEALESAVKEAAAPFLKYNYNLARECLVDYSKALLAKLADQGYVLGQPLVYAQVGRIVEEDSYGPVVQFPKGLPPVGSRLYVEDTEEVRLHFASPTEQLPSEDFAPDTTDIVYRLRNGLQPGDGEVAAQEIEFLRAQLAAALSPYQK